MGAAPALQGCKAWSGSAAVVSSSAAWVLETKAGRANPIFVTMDDLELFGGQGLDQPDAPSSWQL